MKIIKTLGKILLGLIAVLVVLFGLGYILTLGEYTVPATVEQDPSLPSITIEGYTYHAETYGDPANPVVITLHGGPGSDYRSILSLQALSDEYFVVFFDQRGMGLSPRVAPEEITLESVIADLDAIVDYFGHGEKVNIVGHSWGAMLASAYLGEYPEKVDHIVLAEPGFLNSEFANEFAEMTQLKMNFAVLKFFLRLKFESLHINGPDSHASGDYFIHELNLYQGKDHPQAGYYCPGDKPALDGSWRFGSVSAEALEQQAVDENGEFDIDFVSGVEQYDGKVLFMTGECQTYIGVDFQTRQMELFPNAELVVIENAGHEMFSENPEASIQVVRAYLNTPARQNVDLPQSLRGTVTQVEQGKDGLQVQLQTESLLYNVTISQMQTEIDGSFDQIVVGAEIEVTGQGIGEMDPPLIVAEYVRVLGSSPRLSGSAWELTAYNGQQPIRGRQPTLQFEPDQVSGTTGCNHYGGSYQVDDGSIKFEDLYSTEMACVDVPGLMDQERIYLEILGTAQSFEAAEDVLTIVSENGQTLNFQSLLPGASGLDSPSDGQPSVSQTNPTEEPQPIQPINSFELPVGFKEYRDSQTGITIYIPEEWTIQNQSIVEGEYAIFSSYPPDKYIGGGARQPGDTKCDLNLNPSANSADDLIQQWETSAITTIVSEEDIVLNSGNSGIVFIIDSMGRSTTLATEIDNNLVTFTCWGESDLFDEIAVTLH
jgi:proline iminopeptidase